MVTVWKPHMILLSQTLRKVFWAFRHEDKSEMHLCGAFIKEWHDITRFETSYCPDFGFYSYIPCLLRTYRSVLLRRIDRFLGGRAKLLVDHARSCNWAIGYLMVSATTDAHHTTSPLHRHTRQISDNNADADCSVHPQSGKISSEGVCRSSIPTPPPLWLPDCRLSELLLFACIWSQALLICAFEVSLVKLISCMLAMHANIVPEEPQLILHSSLGIQAHHYYISGKKIPRDFNPM